MQSEVIIIQKQKLKNIQKKIIDLDFEGLDSDFKSIDIKSETYYSLLSNYLYLIQKYEDAKLVLKEGIIQKPFSFELTYNLAMIELVMGETEAGLLNLAKCISLAKFSKEFFEEANLQFNKWVDFIQNSDNYSLEEKKSLFNRAKEILKKGNEKCYPINANDTSLIKKTVKDSKNNLYFTSLYQAYGITDVNQDTRLFFTTEMLKGEISKTSRLNLKGPAIIPINPLFSDSELIVEGPETKYNFKKNALDKEQTSYLRFDGNGEYLITSKEDIFIGDKIPLLDEKKSPQIILNIFIDGLAETVIEERLKELMPKTFRFFKDGYINTNCRTTGDWTLPSVAAIYTGKTSLKHGVYHPDLDCKVNKHNELFTASFKKAGYFTSQINNDWRITPTYGYLEDMDRILYQSYVGGFKAGQVVSETIEHLETFKNKNHFMWMSIMDLHDVADGIDNDLMSQVSTDALYRQNKKVGVTSVLSDFDPSKIKKYESEIQRVDLHLSSLYSYLEREFGKENIIVSLISDHGQTYLQHDEFLLHEPKRKVPFMLVGHGIPNKISNELSSIIDIFPSIAKLAGIELDSQEGCILKDFGGTGRDIALTETIHPHQPYMIALTDEEHIFRFKTIDAVNYNCLVDLEEFNVQLLEINTLKDVTQTHKNKVNEYINFVINHAKQIQI